MRMDFPVPAWYSIVTERQDRKKKEQGKKAHEIGRENFSKLCYETTDKYEGEFQELFSDLGVSTDWSMHYKTVSPSTIKISQTSFLDLMDKGHC